MRLLYSNIIIVGLSCCTPLKGRISEEPLHFDKNKKEESTRDIEFAKKKFSYCDRVSKCS